MTCCYPLTVDDDRPLGPDYHGPVFTWDIDKTYLATRFSSLRGLARIPFEFAVDKRAIRGMPEVLRGLRRGPGPGFAAQPLYFVSASPPQIKKVVQRKMLLDGVQPDGFIFKDWGKTLRQLKPGRLRDHVGFKLCALLVGRRLRPMTLEYLFGDDVEADALVYGLYADILKGEASPDEVDSVLDGAGVTPQDRDCVRHLMEELPRARGRVGRIFIHLENRTPPSAFSAYAPTLLAVSGALQMSLALLDLGLVDDRTVHETAAEVGVKGWSDPSGLSESIEDALERGLVSRPTIERLGLDL